MHLLSGSDGKESAHNVGDPGLIPGSGRSLGEGNWQPIPLFLPGQIHGQRILAVYSPWGCKEQARLSNFHFNFLSLVQALKIYQGDRIPDSYSLDFYDICQVT